MMINRQWAMPSKNTFQIKPIKEFIYSELTGGLWIDPFANNNRIATITNDLNPNFDTDYHMDALDFLKMFDDESVDGVLFDPPYSPRQIKEIYESIGIKVTKNMTQSSFWSLLKNEITRIVKKNGKVLCFGWNSQGMGIKREFELTKVLMVAHGGHHNDTICTLEVKRGGNEV